MSFPLEKLRKVRENREQQAARDVQEARRQLDLARDELQRRQELHESYGQERLQQMQALERQYLGKELSMPQLEHWNDSLLWLDERLGEHAQAITEQEEVILQCRKDVSEAKHKQAKLHRALQKVETQKERWTQEAALIAERASELELEESVRLASGM